MNSTEIFTSELPVGEKLSIKRTSFEPLEKANNKIKRYTVGECEFCGSHIGED